MYVISILFIVTSLLFSEDTLNTQKSTAEALKVDAIVTGKRADLKKMGIKPNLCKACETSDRDTALGYINSDKLGSLVDKITSGSCANPSEGSSNWNSSVVSVLGSELATNCCAKSVTTMAGVQDAYDKCKQGTQCEPCKTSQTVRSASGYDTCVADEIYDKTNDSNCDNKQCCETKLNRYISDKKIPACKATYDKIKDQVKSKLDNNYKQCKAFNSSESSLADILKYLATLGILAEQLFGHKTDPTTTNTTVTLSCADKCSNQPDTYNECLCATTETLADGSTRRCMPESKCTPDTTCEGTMNTMKAQGYCTGSDCEDIKQSCICNKVSETTGVSKTWDPASSKCVPVGSGGDNKDNTIKYPGGKTPTDLPSITSTSSEESKNLSPVGTGAPGASNMSSPGAGIDKPTTTKDKDKSKSDLASKGLGAGQAKTGYNQYAGGMYGGPDANGEGATSANATNDIVKETGSDIWKLIRDIYQSGIDANRFMDPKVAANKEKANIKKGTKKAKGKKA